jgi:hypothetical protein
MSVPQYCPICLCLPNVQLFIAFHFWCNVCMHEKRPKRARRIGGRDRDGKPIQINELHQLGPSISNLTQLNANSCLFLSRDDESCLLHPACTLSPVHSSLVFHCYFYFSFFHTNCNPTSVNPKFQHAERAR